MRLRHLAIGLGAVLALGVAAVGGALLYLSQMDVNAYRGVIASQVAAATGRSLDIRGDLRLVLGLSPAVAVSDTTLANAPWASGGPLLEVGRFEAQIDLLRLVTGEIRVDRLVLLKPTIRLETDARGRGNWEFEGAATQPAAAPAPAPAQAGAGPLRLPSVGEVEIRDASVTYRDGASGRVTTLVLARALLRAESDGAPIAIDVAGAFDLRPFELHGHVGSLAALRPGAASPFPFDLTGRLADAAEVKLSGTVREVLAVNGYDVTVNANGGEAAKLVALAGMESAPIGPFSFAARITDLGASGVPALAGIKVEIGRPELVRLRLDGAVSDLLGTKGIALSVDAEGREIAALSALRVPGLALPAIPALGPFKAALRISDGPGGRLALSDLGLELGRADLVRLTVTGAVSDPLQGAGFALAVALDTGEVSALAKRLGIDLPIDGPVRFQARLADSGPQRFALTDGRLTTRVGDLSGRATLSLAGLRPSVTGEISSELIEMPRAVPPRPAAPQRRPDDGRLFSADAVPTEELAHADVDVKYTAKRLNLRGTVIQDLSASVAIKNADLAVRPFSLRVAGGTVSGEASYMQRSGALAARVETRGVAVGTLLREAGLSDYLKGGRSDIAIDVRGAGRSARAIMASLSGTTTLAMGDGEIDNRYVDLLGADVIRVLNPIHGGQQSTKLNCVVQRFDIAGGVATSRVLVIDTARMTVQGEGTINLANEAIAMLLKPSPKERSLFSLATPIRVAGTLARPSFLPDAAGAALGVAGAVAGTALLGPVGIIAPLVSSGLTSEHEACTKALGQAGRSSAPAAAPARPGQPAGRAAPPAPERGIGGAIRDLFGR